MICSPSFFLLSTKYEFRAFPSSASIFRFFKLYFGGKFLKFWQEMDNTNSKMKTMKKKIYTNCKLNRCKISTKQVLSETASLFDLFGAKFPYFGPNFHISGQMSLFRAKCPYFGEKYLKFRPRSEFKESQMILASFFWFRTTFSSRFSSNYRAKATILA